MNALGAAALLAAVGAGIWLALSPKKTPPAKPDAAPLVKPARAAAPARADRLAARRERRVAGPAVPAEVARPAATNAVAAKPAQPPTEDERQAVAMRELLDSGDEKGALRLARQLLESPQEEVRSSVVTVLGWMGLKALPELTVLLADPSEDVANEALTQWKMAFDEIEDDQTRASMLVSAIGSMKKAEDMEALALSFSNLPDGLAVRSLVQVVQGESKLAAEVARDQIQFIMGDPYTTPEAAIQWSLQRDIENAPVNP